MFSSFKIKLTHRLIHSIGKRPQVISLKGREPPGKNRIHRHRFPAYWLRASVISPARPVYQILTDTFFFLQPIPQRGGKLRVDVLRVFPGEVWALRKAFAGGVKILNTSSVVP